MAQLESATHDGVTILHCGAEPRPATHQDRLNRCRPASHGSADIAQALATAQHEAQEAAGRIESARRQRGGLLLRGKPEEIQKTDAEIATMSIEAEQFAAIIEQLTGDIESAHKREKAGGLYLQDLANAANSATAKFKAWLGSEYVKHARAIADGLEKFEQPVIEAFGKLEAAKHHNQNAPSPICDPRPLGNVYGSRRSFGQSVVLPGIGDDAAYAQPPAQHRSRPVVNLADAYAR